MQRVFMFGLPLYLYWKYTGKSICGMKTCYLAMEIKCNQHYYQIAFIIMMISNDFFVRGIMLLGWLQLRLNRSANNLSEYAIIDNRHSTCNEMQAKKCNTWMQAYKGTTSKRDYGRNVWQNQVQCHRCLHHRDAIDSEIFFSNGK